MTESMLTNYYSILQVHTDAEQEIIEAAYKRLARKYHPDINSTPDTTARMQKINEAYEVLADPEKRRFYDRDNLQKVLGDIGLRNQSGLLESRFLEEQMLREEKEDELASAMHELRMEQFRRKRAERTSARLADQLKEESQNKKQHHPPASPFDAASSQAAQLQLHRKIRLLEKDLVRERLQNKRIQEELLAAAKDLAEERDELESANKRMARLGHLLAAEREQREALIEANRLSEYERRAIEKFEELRPAEQACQDEIVEQENQMSNKGLPPSIMTDGMLKEEISKRERAEKSLAAVRKILLEIAKELKGIFLQ